MVGVSLILVLGVGAQWLAWRLRLPSILLLLAAGFIAGPVLKGFGSPYYLDPAVILGEDLIMRLVPLAVGLILFEGGLTLSFGEFKRIRSAVMSLVTIGAVVTGVLASIAAHYLLGLSWQIAILFGSILTVTGPTVVGPLLRHVRPVGNVGSVLKWEGIVIDPIGAMFAVLVFEAILAGHTLAGGELAGSVAAFFLGAAKTAGVGTVIGVALAGLLVIFLRRFWIPDYLQVPFTLMLAASAFELSNYFVHESGLYTTTVMGIVLANQKRAHIRHIVEFKETLTVLLIAILFIVLSAQLDLESLAAIGIGGAAAFLAALIFIVRPAAVFASTIGSRLNLREKLFLCWMAPRGIVAASVASVFALRLANPPEGSTATPIPEAALLVPYMFMVIVATVAIYGSTASLVARRLGLAKKQASGFLIVGAHPLARHVAKALQEQKLDVLLVDTNYQNITAARLEGIPTFAADALSPQVLERIELSGIGRLLSLTGNDEVNRLACLQFSKVFGRAGVFQLPMHKQAQMPGTPEKEADPDLNGRILFGQEHTFESLAGRVEAGATMKRTRLTREFDAGAFKRQYGTSAVPMFIVTDAGGVQVITTDATLTLKPGLSVLSLVTPPVAEAPPAGGTSGSADASSMAQAVR